MVVMLVLFSVWSLLGSIVGMVNFYFDCFDLVFCYGGLFFSGIV